MKVLVIDDNKDIGEVVSFYCDAKSDIDCKVINSGKEGLEAISNGLYDLILLDLAMPEFSGYDIFKSLKKEGLIKTKNIVLFTASSERTMVEELIRSGVKEVLKKPCSLDELANLIEKYRPR